MFNGQHLNMRTLSTKSSKLTVVDYRKKKKKKNLPNGTTLISVIMRVRCYMCDIIIGLESTKYN